MKNDLTKGNNMQSLLRRPQTSARWLAPALALSCCLWACEVTYRPYAEDTEPQDLDSTDTELAEELDEIAEVEELDQVDDADQVEEELVDPYEPWFGMPFPHEGDEPPWGVHFEIVEITGATAINGAFRIGDSPTVVFRVVDDDGVPWRPVDLQSISFGMAGPSNNMAMVYYGYALGKGGNVIDQIKPKWLGGYDLSKAIGWSFTFPTPIPDKYLPPPNDTADFGVDVGDWGGLPLVAGSYAVGIWGYKQFNGGKYGRIREGNSATQWVRLGNVDVLEPRERVLSENCATCHGPAISSHGGTIVGEPELCILCHVQGAEDRYSDKDPLTTPRTSIYAATMYHKIHSGPLLSQPYIVNGHPSNPNAPGYPNYNAHDFSEVIYPAWPNRTGACLSCHANAPQGNIEEKATRNACGACHDNINWATGTNHNNSDGTSVGPTPDDSQCGNAGCHEPSFIVSIHLDQRVRHSGFSFEILEVEPGTGARGQLMVGDTIRVKLRFTNFAGIPMSYEEVIGHNTSVDEDPTHKRFTRFAIRLSGPVENMQVVVQESNIHNKLDTPGFQYNANDNTWTYTFVNPVPALYPAQANNTDFFGYADGDWGGTPVIGGTYRISVNGVLNLSAGIGASRNIPGSATTSVLVGTAMQIQKRELVKAERCEGCHENIWAHGDGYAGYDLCVTCHVAGAEDRNSTAAPSTTPGVSMEWGTMMHKIHAGSTLTQNYDILGFAPPPAGFVSHNFNHVVFPRFDGRIANCTACHEPGTDRGTKASGCLACHDSLGARSHAALNTDPVYGESCNVCHGIGQASGIDKVHNNHNYWHP